MMNSGETNHHVHHRATRSSRLTERRTSLSPIYDTTVATSNTPNPGESSQGDRNKTSAKKDESMTENSVKNPSKNEVILDDNENYMYDSCYEEDFDDLSALNNVKNQLKLPTLNSYEERNQKFDDKLPDLQYSSTYLAASSNEKEKFYIIGLKMDVSKVSLDYQPIVYFKVLISSLITEILKDVVSIEKVGPNSKTGTTNLSNATIKANKASNEQTNESNKFNNKQQALVNALANETRINKQATPANTASINNQSKIRNHFENTYNTQSYMNLLKHRKSIDEYELKEQQQHKQSDLYVCFFIFISLFSSKYFDWLPIPFNSFRRSFVLLQQLGTHIHFTLSSPPFSVKCISMKK